MPEQNTGGPVLDDDLSMGTDEYSLGGGYEDDDYAAEGCGCLFVVSEIV